MVTSSRFGQRSFGASSLPSSSASRPRGLGGLDPRLLGARLLPRQPLLLIFCGLENPAAVYSALVRRAVVIVAVVAMVFGLAPSDGFGGLVYALPWFCALGASSLSWFCGSDLSSPARSAPFAPRSSLVSPMPSPSVWRLRIDWAVSSSPRCGSAASVSFFFLFLRVRLPEAP